MKALKTLLLIFVFAVTASNVLALTVSGVDAPTICPDKVYPTKCKLFFSAITLASDTTGQVFLDNDLSPSLKNTELGYFPKGSEIKITWQEYGDKSSHDHYDLRYRCAKTAKELLFDDWSIHSNWKLSEKYWQVPYDFSWYKAKDPCYCKIWIASKTKYISGQSVDNVGGANTRSFRICPIQIPPEVQTLDPDYSKISENKAIVEGNLVDLGRNEDREVFDKMKDVEVLFEYRFTEANGTPKFGIAYPNNFSLDKTGKFQAQIPEKSFSMYIAYEYRAVANNKLSGGAGLAYGEWKSFNLEPLPPPPPVPDIQRETDCSGGSKNILFVPSPKNKEVLGSLPWDGQDWEKFNIRSLAFGQVTEENIKEYDTIILQPQSCNAKSNLSQKSKDALAKWVQNGGKLIIYDAQCGFVNRMSKADYLWLGQGGFLTIYPGSDQYNTNLRVPKYFNWTKQNFSYIDLQILKESPAMMSDYSSNFNYINTSKIAFETNAAGTQSFIEPANKNVWCANMLGKNFAPKDEGTAGVSHAYSYVGKGMIIYNGLGRDSLTETTKPSTLTGDQNLAKLFYLELDLAWGKPECKLECANPMDNMAFFVATKDIIFNEQLDAVLYGEVLKKMDKPNWVGFDIGYIKSSNPQNYREVIYLFSTQGSKNIDTTSFNEMVLSAKIIDLTGINKYYYRAKAIENGKTYYGIWAPIIKNDVLGRIFMPKDEEITTDSVVLKSEVVAFGKETMMNVNFRLWEKIANEKVYLKSGGIVVPQSPFSSVKIENLIPNQEYCYTIFYANPTALSGGTMKILHTFIGPQQYCFKTKSLSPSALTNIKGIIVNKNGTFMKGNTKTDIGIFNPLFVSYPKFILAGPNAEKRINVIDPIEKDFYANIPNFYLDKNNYCITAAVISSTTTYRSIKPICSPGK